MAMLEERTARIEEKIDRILDEVTRINGRVGRLETWKAAQDNDAAYRRGRSEAVITKRTLAISITAISGIVVTVNTLIRLLIG